MNVKISAQGVVFSDELLGMMTVVDTGAMDLIDTLTSMKVAPPDTIHLCDTQVAVFLVNNADMFGLVFDIVHPEEDNIDIYNAAWLGLERFNNMITEVELVKMLQPAISNDDNDEGKGKPAPRFGHAYARLTKTGEAKATLSGGRPANSDDSSVEDEDD